MVGRFSRFILYGVSKRFLIKVIIALLLFILGINVFAQEVDVTSNCYGSTGYARMYSGDEVQYQTYSNYNFGVTYQKQLSSFETELRYQLAANTNYTVTFNTNGGNDFRNNFRTWSVYDKNNNDNDLVTGFTFISMKKIQITFQTTTATDKVKIQFGGANSYDNITGENNWNIKNVILTVPDGSPTGSTTQDVIDNQTNNTNSIINNNNQNTTDIIDNANQNTQSIIDNQNTNQEQTNQLLGQCFKNLYNYSRVSSLTNFNYSNGSYVQYQADSAVGPRLKLQFFSTLSYQGFVGVSDYNPIISVGRFKWTFQKNNTFSYISFGVNGSDTDTLVNGYSVNNLENGKTYSLIYDVTNATQGSITISNVMIIEGSTLIPYVEYNKSYCESKIDGVSGAISDIGQQAAQNAQDIINNQNSNAQQQIESEKVCNKRIISKESIVQSGYILNSNGDVVSFTGWGVTDYIEFSDYIKKLNTSGIAPSICFYDKNKTLVSCFANPSLPVGNITILPTYKYFRATISLNAGTPQYETLVCKNGNQALNDSVTDINDTLNNSNVESGTGSDFFDNFTTDDNGGISAIITKPLTIVNNLLSNNNSCANLNLPDFMGATNVYLPSGCILWNNAPSIVVTLWNIFVCGLGAYYVLKELFKLVEVIKNPDNDRVEVMDL